MVVAAPVPSLRYVHAIPVVVVAATAVAIAAG
jgi:hypothetical protein